MLDIPDLAAQWGKIFGGINEINTFRGTTLYTRADTISALYTTAAEQRLASEGLYSQVVSADSGLDTTVQFFFNMSKETLKVASVEDSEFPIALDDDTLLAKLINDAVAQAQTFQLPTVQIGGASTVNATGVTTLQGAPFGNGVIVGTIINPRTGVVKYYSYEETIRLTCSVDSYTGGATAGQETFAVQSFASVDVLDSEWPKGSGVNTTMQSAGTNVGTLIANAYFDTWLTSNANTPTDWTVNVLVPGTTLFQSTDAYSSPYAATLTAAIVNSELIQPINGLQGNQNYVAGIRVKRATAITGGVLTVALRDASGTILTNALGSNMSFTVALTGSSGAYILTTSVFSVPRGFSTPAYLSLKITTAMNAAESIRLDNVELIPMQSTYVGGPDIAFVPGNVGWAFNDTYTFAVTNSADTGSFVKLFDRLYNTRARDLDLPVAGSPTISDSLIS